MGKRKPSQTTLSISLPRWLVEAIKTEAEHEHRSASGYIAYRMEQYIAREHPGLYSASNTVINGHNNSIHIRSSKTSDKKH